jgi:hypothetical protein
MGFLKSLVRTPKYALRNRASASCNDCMLGPIDAYSKNGSILKSLPLKMPFHRNFIYWIDKRKWKYVFLLTMLELSVA